MKVPIISGFWVRETHVYKGIIRMCEAWNRHTRIFLASSETVAIQ